MKIILKTFRRSPLLLAILFTIVGLSTKASAQNIDPCLGDKLTELNLEYLGTHAVAGIQAVDIKVWREYRRGNFNEQVGEFTNVTRGDLVFIDPEAWTSANAGYTITELRAETYFEIFESGQNFDPQYRIGEPISIITDCQQAIVSEIYHVDREVGNEVEVYEFVVLGHVDNNQPIPFEWSINHPLFPTQPWETKGNIVSPDNYMIGSRNSSDVRIGTQGTEHVRVTTEGFMGIGIPNPKSNLDVSGNLTIGRTYAGTVEAPLNGLLVQGKVGLGEKIPEAQLHIVPSVIDDEAMLIGTGTPESSDYRNSITFTELNTSQSQANNALRWLDGQGQLGGAIFGSLNNNNTLYLASQNEIKWATGSADIQNGELTNERMVLTQEGKLGIGIGNFYDDPSALLPEVVMPKTSIGDDDGTFLVDPNHPVSGWNSKARLGIMNRSTDDKNYSVVTFDNALGSTSAAIMGVHLKAEGEYDARASVNNRSGELRFGTADKDNVGALESKMVIAGNGNVGIATDPDFSFVPENKLEIKANSVDESGLTFSELVSTSETYTERTGLTDFPTDKVLTVNSKGEVILVETTATQSRNGDTGALEEELEQTKNVLEATQHQLEQTNAKMSKLEKELAELKACLSKLSNCNTTKETERESNSILDQNYPNPFKSKTTITYFLDAESVVELKIYDNKGEYITTLVSEKQKGGEYSVEWEAKDLNSGLYIYTLTVNGKDLSKRAILTKN